MRGFVGAGEAACCQPLSAREDTGTVGLYVRPRVGPGLGACQGQVDVPGNPGFSCRLALCWIPGTDYSCLCPLQIQRKAVPRLLPPGAWPSSPLALLVSGHTLPVAPGGT